MRIVLSSVVPIKSYFILSFNIINTFFFLIGLVSRRHMLNSMWFQFNNDFFKTLSVFALLTLYKLKFTFRSPGKEIILLSCNDTQKTYCFKISTQLLCLNLSLLYPE